MTKIAHCLRGIALASAALAGCSWQWGVLEDRFDANAAHDATTTPETGPTPDVARDAPSLSDRIDVRDAGDVLSVPDVTDAGDVFDAVVPLDVVSDTIAIVDVPVGVDACGDACGTSCPAGTEPGPAPGQCFTAVPPQLFAPMSNSVVAVRRPTLQVRLRDATSTEFRPTALRVTICDDALCNAPTTMDVPVPATGSVVDVTPVVAIAPGEHLWWATSMAGGIETGKTPSWSFWVPAGTSARVDSFTAFSPTDVTSTTMGDGFADLVASGSFNANSFVMLFPGAATGPTSGSAVALTHLVSSMSGAFGSSIALMGVLFDAGARDTVVAASDAGDQSVSLFRVSSATMGTPVQPSQVITRATAAGFGASIAALGDANLAGAVDLAVGAPGDNAVFVYPGETMLNTVQILDAVRCRLPCPVTSFGNYVAAAGDLDGDGHADLFVAGTGSSTCEVYGYDAARTAFFSLGVLHPPGSSVAGAAGVGDLNADGYGDLIVGTDTGFYVYLGASSGVADAPDKMFAVPGITAIAAIGDIDGDRRVDFAVANHSSGYRGLSLYYGIYSPYFATSPADVHWPTFQITEPESGTGGPSALGEHLAMAGDLDGDGHGDLIASDTANNRVAVFLGQSAGPPTRVNLNGPATLTSFGTAVASRRPHSPPRGRASRSL